MPVKPAPSEEEFLPREEGEERVSGELQAECLAEEMGSRALSYFECQAGRAVGRVPVSLRERPQIFVTGLVHNGGRKRREAGPRSPRECCPRETVALLDRIRRGFLHPFGENGESGAVDGH